MEVASGGPRRPRIAELPRDAEWTTAYPLPLHGIDASSAYTYDRDAGEFDLESCGSGARNCEARADGALITWAGAVPLHPRHEIVSCS
jgi:hypothetical protein